MIRCLCECHRESRVLPFAGVSVEDGIEAVTACSRCINAHCPALLHTRALTEPEPEFREMAVWADPDPPSEGPEA